MSIRDVAFNRGEMEQGKSVEIVDVKIGSVLGPRPAHITADDGVRFPVKTLMSTPVQFQFLGEKTRLIKNSLQNAVSCFGLSYKKYPAVVAWVVGASSFLIL